MIKTEELIKCNKKDSITLLLFRLNVSPSRDRLACPDDGSQHLALLRQSENYLYRQLANKLDLVSSQEEAVSLMLAGFHGFITSAVYGRLYLEVECKVRC